jgi:hypothetical protein
LEWKSDGILFGGIDIWHEDLVASLILPEQTEVPRGRYNFGGFHIGYDMSPGRLLGANFEAGFSQFYDGRRAHFFVQPVWKVARHLRLSGDYNVEIVRFPERHQGFDTHLFRLRAQAALDTKISLQAFVQYNSAADLIATNARFRYNLREGNDLWVVYNEGLNVERERNELILLRTNERTVLLKYTYTFARI